MTGYRIKVVNNEEMGITPKQSYVLEAANKAVDDLVTIEIYSIREGAILVIDNIEHIYDLLSDEAQAILHRYKLKAIQPEWMSPLRTLFASKVPLVITEDRDAASVARELHRCNPNLKLEYLNIIRGRQEVRGRETRDTLKMTFVTAEMADRASQDGIKLFNYNIRPEGLEKEIYMKIDQCFKCFSFDHTSSLCQRPACKCSICGGEHHYRKCPRKDSPRCINCSGNHPAVANVCRIKRERMEEKRNKMNDKIKERNHNQSRANAGQYSLQYPKLPKKQGITAYSNTINEDGAHINDNNNKDIVTANTGKSVNYNSDSHDLTMSLKINAIQTYATMKSAGDPELFLKIINKFLADHNMTEIPHPLRETRRPINSNMTKKRTKKPQKESVNSNEYNDESDEEEQAYSLLGTLPDGPSPIPEHHMQYNNATLTTRAQRMLSNSGYIYNKVTANNNNNQTPPYFEDSPPSSLFGAQALGEGNNNKYKNRMEEPARKLNEKGLDKLKKQQSLVSQIVNDNTDLSNVMKDIKEKYPNTSWDKSNNSNYENQALTSSSLSSFSFTIHNSQLRDKAGHTPGITLNKLIPLSDIEDNEEEDKSLRYTEESEEEGELKVDDETTDASDNDEPDKSEDRASNHDEDINSNNPKNRNKTSKDNASDKKTIVQNENENTEEKSKQQTKTAESTLGNPENKDSRTGAISKNNKVNKKDNNNKPNTRSNKQ